MIKSFNISSEWTSSEPIRKIKKLIKSFNISSELISFSWLIEKVLTLHNTICSESLCTSCLLSWSNGPKLRKNPCNIQIWRCMPTKTVQSSLQIIYTYRQNSCLEYVSHFRTNKIKSLSTYWVSNKIKYYLNFIYSN